MDRKVEQFDREIERYGQRPALRSTVGRWTEIPGIKDLIARVAVAELGTNMQQFETSDDGLPGAVYVPGITSPPASENPDGAHTGTGGCDRLYYKERGRPSKNVTCAACAGSAGAKRE